MTGVRWRTGALLAPLLAARCREGTGTLPAEQVIRGARSAAAR